MNALPKRSVAVIVLLLIFLSVATTASALSVQLRGGKDNGDPGKGSDVGLDVFFYEGRSFDFFIGYDRISVSDKHTITLTSGASVQATTDAAIDALMIGLRYKMQTSSSWKPFWSFGIAYLSTEFTPPANLQSYYEKPFEQSSTSATLGLGVDVGISDNWSLGLEGRLFMNVPYYEDYLGFGGKLTLDSYGVLSQLGLSLRYHFE